MDNWLRLPELLFSDIMMMVGLESLNRLHGCRQVCSTWNEMILRVIWESPSKRRIMKERIERSWGPDMFPSDEQISRARWLEKRAILDTAKIQRLIERVREALGELFLGKSELTCAACLACHGLLGSLRYLYLCNVDLSSVPALHLASLASGVTGIVEIQNVTGCDLVSILTSLKCKVLVIYSQSLGSEESQALVQAMETGVKFVRLCGEEVTLDIEALAEYSGQGVCKRVVLRCPLLAEPRLSNVVQWRPMYHKLSRAVEEMSWARSRNWRVENYKDGMLLKRN